MPCTCVPRVFGFTSKSNQLLVCERVPNAYEATGRGSRGLVASEEIQEGCT